MRELALNVLDIAENSLAAGAKNIEILLWADFGEDKMRIDIKDDGCGMDEETVKKVTDPFTTSRKTRSVGMGLPLFRYSAESTGGRFEIRSEKGKGTEVFAEYRIGHIDRMPLGDFGGVVLQLITMNPQVDFLVTVECLDQKGALDTREIKEILGEIPLDTPEVRAFLKDYIRENLVSIYGGRL